MKGRDNYKKNTLGFLLKNVMTLNAYNQWNLSVQL